MDDFKDEVWKILSSTAVEVWVGALVNICMSYMLSVCAAKAAKATADQATTKDKSLAPDGEKDVVGRLIEATIGNAIAEVMVEAALRRAVEQTSFGDICFDGDKGAVEELSNTGEEGIEMAEGSELGDAQDIAVTEATADISTKDKDVAQHLFLEGKDDVGAFVEATIENAVAQIMVETVFRQAVCQNLAHFVQASFGELSINGGQKAMIEDVSSVEGSGMGDAQTVTEATVEITTKDTDLAPDLFLEDVSNILIGSVSVDGSAMGDSQALAVPDRVAKFKMPSECFGLSDTDGVSGRQYVSLLFEGVEINTPVLSATSDSSISAHDGQQHQVESTQCHIAEPEIEQIPESRQREGLFQRMRKAFHCKRRRQTQKRKRCRLMCCFGGTPED